MALDRSLEERALLRRRLAMVLLAVAVCVVLVVGAAIVFDWTLTAGTGFDSTITSDPAGDLPF
ncbi:MAG: hypothetical protein AB1736_13795 [Chloroflexota bacterium]